MNQTNFSVTSFRCDAGMWIPRRIELDGVSYSFVDRGLKMHVATKRATCMLLALSDGLRTFHMKIDSKGSNWIHYTKTEQPVKLGL